MPTTFSIFKTQMYSDHKKGFNKNHSDKSRIELFKKHLKAKTAPSIQANPTHYQELENHFDNRGEVIRDYKKEIEIYSQDEIERLLPQIPNEDFESIRKRYLEFQYKEKIGFKTKVDTVPVVGIPEIIPDNQPKSSMFDLFNLKKVILQPIRSIASMF